VSGPVGKLAEYEIPTVSRVERRASSLGLFAVALEIAVLEVDACAVGTVASESNLYLGHEVRVEGPRGVELPTKQDPSGRIPSEDPTPGAFASVYCALVPSAAWSRLDNNGLPRRLEERVAEWPPVVHAIYEHVKRTLGRDTDADTLADGRESGGGGHAESSS
jgi:hypothetical protein